MKVYVSEFPNICENCPCCGDCDYADYEPYATRRPLKCPLQSLSDYAKQVRKEVVQDIKKKAELFGVCKTGTIAEEYHISKYVLDQIQGEYK